jgi:hypothetical protein
MSDSTSLSTFLTIKVLMEIILRSLFSTWVTMVHWHHMNNMCTINQSSRNIYGQLKYFENDVIMKLYYDHMLFIIHIHYKNFTDTKIRNSRSSSLALKGSNLISRNTRVGSGNTKAKYELNVLHFWCYSIDPLCSFFFV